MPKPEGLAKWERLCRRSAINRLFSDGSSLKAYPLRLVYLPVTEAEARAAILPSVLARAPYIPRLQVLFSVPKRNLKKAVSRNLVKRRLREAFRRQKNSLSFSNSQYYIIAIVYMAREPRPYAELAAKLNEALQRLPHIGPAAAGPPS